MPASARSCIFRAFLIHYSQYKYVCEGRRLGVKNIMPIFKNVSVFFIAMALSAFYFALDAAAEPTLVLNPAIAENPTPLSDHSIAENSVPLSDSAPVETAVLVSDLVATEELVSLSNSAPVSDFAVAENPVPLSDHSIAENSAPVSDSAITENPELAENSVPAADEIDDGADENAPTNSPELGGETVVNNSNEYVLIKTENTGFVILAPNTTYTGENVPGYDYAEGEDKIDGGKIDGVIASSGKILKVSDTELLPKNVHVIVEDGDDDVEMKVTSDTNLLNKTADMMKMLANTFSTMEKELSGIYSVGDGSGAGDWIPRPPTQEELMEMLDGADSLFIAKSDMKTYLNV